MMILIPEAGIETANDYTKKSFVFRLHVTDGSEFLFAAESQVSSTHSCATENFCSVPVRPIPVPVSVNHILNLSTSYGQMLFKCFFAHN